MVSMPEPAVNFKGHPGPVNDWLWRTVKAGGSVTIPRSLYVGQRIHMRHELEVVEETEDEGGESGGTVTLAVHRAYTAALYGQEADGTDKVDSERAAVPPADVSDWSVHSGDGDENGPLAEVI